MKCSVLTQKNLVGCQGTSVQLWVLRGPFSYLVWNSGLRQVGIFIKCFAMNTSETALLDK